MQTEKCLTFTDALDLTRSQTCKLTFWAVSQLLMDKLPPTFNTMLVEPGPLTRLFKKHLGSLELETYTNALRWPPFYKKKNIFDHNCLNNPLTMMILLSRQMILWLRNSFPQWPWTFKVMTFAKSWWFLYVRWPITAIPCINFASITKSRPLLNKVAGTSLFRKISAAASSWSCGRQYVKLRLPLYEVVAATLWSCSCQFVKYYVIIVHVLGAASLYSDGRQLL